VAFVIAALPSFMERRVTGGIAESPWKRSVLCPVLSTGSVQIRCSARRAAGHVLERASREDLADGVRKFQRYRCAIAENAGVVVELCERQNILQYHLDRRVTLADFDDERIRHLATRVCLDARSPPPRPQVRTTCAADICQTPQYRILTLAVELQVFLFLNADTDDICVRAYRIPEAAPLNIFEPHAAMNEHFLWRLADSLRITM
jgi:hypothetical protein